MKSEAITVFEKALRLTEGSGEKSKRTKRLTYLLKSPEDDETSGWFMCVPSYFNNALDIRQTPRKKDGKEVLVWTQGSAFCFKAGDKIFDSPKAYSEWSEALKRLSVCISVQESTNATPEKKNVEQSEVIPRNPGSVHFSILIPNDQKTTLVKCGEFQLTQDEFVLLLIKGPQDELKKKIQWKQ